MGLAFGGFGAGGLELSGQTVVTVLGAGILIGALSGAFPAIAAARLRIVDGLRRI